MPKVAQTTYPLAVSIAIGFQQVLRGGFPIHTTAPPCFKGAYPDIDVELVPIYRGGVALSITSAIDKL